MPKKYSGYHFFLNFITHRHDTCQKNALKMVLRLSRFLSTTLARLGRGVLVAREIVTLRVTEILA